jgi:hypothetical protein
MGTGSNRIREIDEPVRGGDAPAAGASQPRGSGAGALSITRAEALSMDKVSRFFDPVIEPRGNVLVSEMVDDNGPPAGKESVRARRRSGSLALQFSEDGDQSLLFAPNDAPDELPQQPTELDRLLRQQELRERRRFSA